MAEATLNAGSRSLDAANWSDATGFANDAELAIVNSYQEHTGLDRSSDTTTGVDYLHIRDGEPRFGPGNGRLMVDFDATYTAKPNFRWATKGGLLYLEATTTMGRGDFVGAGNCYLVAGQMNNLAIGNRNSVKIQEGCDAGATQIVLAGRAYLEADAPSGAYTIPTLRMTHGSPVALIKRRVENAYLVHGLLTVRNESGSSMTQLDLFGGVFRPEAGDVDTVNWYGGEFDLSRARKALTIGGTAFNVYHDRQIPDSTELVTMSAASKWPASGGPGGPA